MFAVRHWFHRHGQRWVRNRRQVLKSQVTQNILNAKGAKASEKRKKKSKMYFLRLFCVYLLAFSALNSSFSANYLARADMMASDTLRGASE